RGFSVAIVDAEAENLSPEEAAARTIGLDPMLVAIVVYGHQPSASTQNMTGASAVTTALKQLSPDTKILMIGGHVAALAARTLAEEQCDFVAGDEGLHACVDLIAALRASENPDLAAVHGLVYRRDGRVVTNPAAPLVTNLDEEMPGIAWDLLPMSLYRAHNWHCFGHLERQPYAALYTTLGCPYHCSFCLASGTTIVTAQGRNKKIQNVRVGDKLMAWDEKEGKLSHTTVVATGCREVADL